MKFAFIRDHLSDYPAGVCCRVLQVSRSGYYAWRVRSPGPRSKWREEMAGKIGRVHEQNRGVYGSPRVHQVLLIEGQSICLNSVASIMKQRQIRAKTKKRFLPKTTDSAHGKPVADNLLDRDFAAERPNQKWVVDITYIPTDEGWLYLAAVMDLHSRMIVGWAMAEHMREQLVIDALKMAIDQRRPTKDLLHHSDQGSQYVAENYEQLLKSRNITVSMSGKGQCWDNAAMESFWATLKTEEVYPAPYATRQQGMGRIFEYMEVFYNRQRLHSSLGYKSPEAFEASSS